MVSSVLTICIICDTRLQGHATLRHYRHYQRWIGQQLCKRPPMIRHLCCHNTIKSYRETFRIFLTYCKGCGLFIERLRLQQIDERFIVGFLSWLEQDRKSSIATRNQRLACIHGFFHQSSSVDLIRFHPLSRTSLELGMLSLGEHYIVAKPAQQPVQFINTRSNSP